MTKKASKMLADRIKEGKCPICNKVINPKYSNDYKFIVVPSIFPTEFPICKKHPVKGDVV